MEDPGEPAAAVHEWPWKPRWCAMLPQYN